MGAEERGSQLAAGAGRESATHLPATETCVYLVIVRLDGISLRIGSLESPTPSVSFRAAPLIQSGALGTSTKRGMERQLKGIHPSKAISYAVAKAHGLSSFKPSLFGPIFWSNFRQLRVLHSLVSAIFGLGLLQAAAGASQKLNVAPEVAQGSAEGAREFRRGRRDR